MNFAADGTEFVHFDEFEDAVVAIELVGSQSVDVQTRPSQWKWIVLAMQNALQGAMVIALSGTDGCGALAPKSQRENRAWLQHLSPKRPRRFMADYNELLERIRKPELVEGPVPDLSAEDYLNLQRLNDGLRRQFAHFNPTGWGIELNYLLNIMPVALNLFEFLTTTQGRPNIHFTEAHRVRMKRALAQARAAVEAFKKQPVAQAGAQRMTNELQECALQMLSEFAERFLCIKAVHLFGSVARGATDEANDVDVFFEYADDMKFSTAQVAAFTDFQGELELWLLLATETLGKPVKPCCTYYGQRDEDIWQAIKDTPPTASLGKAFIVPTPPVAK